ncbi:hypothetical protein N0V90_004101 [Kalmusia sp. IMI 367209]|nr:hypothetical protein N0V90_004101 [Kalmusia sp. IMI 367209]
MLNLLASIAKNGWRETFRIIYFEDTAIRKKPVQRYAHVRRRDRKGRKTPTAVYQRVETEADQGVTKIYRKVGDGYLSLDDEEEVVLRKKTRIEGERGRQAKQLAESLADEESPLSSERSNAKARLIHQYDVHDSEESQSSEPSTSESLKSDTPSASKDGSPNRRSYDSANDELVRSPFSQPSMNRRDSHAFVFGEDALAPSPPERMEDSDTVPPMNTGDLARARNLPSRRTQKVSFGGISEGTGKKKG